MRDMNVHSPIENSQQNMKKNVRPLKELIKNYELIVNNDPDFATHPSSQSAVFIIDLTLNSLELGLLCL